MKSLLAPLLLLAITPACSISFGGMGEKVVTTSTLHFEPSASADTLNIDSFNGSITLATGTETSALDGAAEIWARGKTVKQAEERLQQMGWQFSQDGNTVYLKLTEPSGGSNNAGSAITSLTVPEGWNLALDTSNGNVTVPIGLGNLDIYTGNGAVIVKASPNQIVGIRTSNGSVEVSGGKTVAVDTSNGAIDYRGSTRDLNLDTSNGSITLDLKGDWDGNAILDSSNGKVTVRCNGILNTRLRTSTSNGKVYVYGPPLSDSTGVGLLDIDTSNSNISVTHTFPNK